jgi:DNA invertase Pin-like site-specific DNA recombinase
MSCLPWREMIRERTKQDWRARANGHKGGGKHTLSETRQAEVKRQILSGEKTQSEVARDERVSKSTISRMMARVKL